MKVSPAGREREVIGWREVIGLPELGISQMAAKIDTGARTSALHAEGREVFERSGQRWVRFRAPGGADQQARIVEAPIKVEREIKNTSGIPERRFVIRTLLMMGRHRWHIEVSLADRDAMAFDLIIGRTALKGRRILVDPARSYLSALDPAPYPQTDDMRRLGVVPAERNTQ